MTRRALFLDRDGTLVHPFHYPSRPEHLRLYDTIASELRSLQKMDFALIIITNQAGIARGYFTESDLERMHDYLTTELSRLDIHIDGIYHCPHHPDGVVPELSFRCDCRKPQPGMLLRAAQELDIDLRASWFVGDILDDVEAGNRAGCRTVLVDLGTEHLPTSISRYPTFVAQDTRHALQIISAVETTASTLNLTYRPASWQTTYIAEGDPCKVS